MAGKIIIRTMNNTQFQFQFKSPDGVSVLNGEPRPSRARAREDADALRRGALEDGRYAVTRDGRGRFYFSFLGEMGEAIGESARFESPEEMGRAIAALKDGAPGAAMDDLA